MRLASLARKLKIAPSKISQYLLSEGIALPNGTNTKLEESTINDLLKHFDVEMPVEVIIEELVEEVQITEFKEVETEESVAVEVEETPTVIEAEVEIESEQIPESPLVEEEIVVEVIENSVEISENQIEEQEIPIFDGDDELSYTERAALADVDIIKAPKIKLQGLTVMGKIDLPQPKVKDEPKEEEIEVEAVKEASVSPDKIVYTSGPKKERRPHPKQRDRRSDPNYNPIEEARKRKEKDEKRALERKVREEKEAKKKHYQSKVAVQPTVIATAKKTAKKKSVHIKKEKKQTGGNMLQKFWRWMNS